MLVGPDGYGQVLQTIKYYVNVIIPMGHVLNHFLVHNLPV